MTFLTNLFYILSKKHSFFKWYNVINTINFFNFTHNALEHEFLKTYIFKYIYVLQLYLKCYKLNLLARLNLIHFNKYFFLNAIDLKKKYTFFNVHYNTQHFNLVLHREFFFGICYKALLFELYKFNKVSAISLPTRNAKETILRSPFVFKKGREQYKKKIHHSLYSYSDCLKKTVLNSFQKKMFTNSFFKHKYLSN